MQQTQYTSDELIRIFTALLDSYDFEAEVAIFGFRKHQFIKKKKALRELAALFIALWDLALQKSFPTERELVFEEFVNRYSYSAKGSNKDVELQLRSIEVYVTLLQKNRDKDFSEVAAFLADLMLEDQGAKDRARLKLALAIRAMFRLIFDRLI
ncbi:hypothetical protein N1030_12945 [Desulfovibrio mangrovi]|uniref:hypothetical protein n=1 Tax=Desulfovibrio mangrovi TaxID=2976983 RepID=UPI002245E32E|nr:hypothetical protein [Desulfovibrio mangrovi]UZP66509.1 hypothetical protein N1030_12945 [Desulfovibrio mangrovi]